MKYDRLQHKPYGLTHPTWGDPSCFYYDTPEEAHAAMVKTYGENSGHLVVGVISTAPRQAEPTDQPKEA